MYVNPFWLGVLLTLVTIVVLMIVAALILSHKEEQETRIDDDEILKGLEGKKFIMHRDKDGYLVGEEIEDPTDDDCK